MCKNTLTAICGLFLLLTTSVRAEERIYQTGKASYYGYAHAGKKTASGSIFNPQGLTAAHNRLPMGTIVEVRRVSTGQSVVVKITDTGGFAKYGRIIDLSEKAANLIGITHKNGVDRVEIRILHRT